MKRKVVNHFWLVQLVLFVSFVHFNFSVHAAKGGNKGTAPAINSVVFNPLATTACAGDTACDTLTIYGSDLRDAAIVIRFTWRFRHCH